ncbi:MAG: peptide deformylase [Gemmatimonadota bacterium]|nr:peptide deformylase [Gemmatimonadota bacterium]
MVRDIVVLGHPALRSHAEPVAEFDDELRTLVDDLFETMYHAEGIGLAANQIGILRQVLVVDIGDKENAEAGRVALVNPKITAATHELDRQSEGCLSIPGVEEVVERPWGVRVEGFDPEGNAVTVEAEALLGRALQHEVDHLEGTLFIDRLSPLKRRLLVKKWKKSRTEAGSIK